MKWDCRFLALARHVALWSKDPSSRVCAVIVDRDKRIISLGYNGPPKGVPDDPQVSRDAKLKRTLHAEQNAILFARRDLTGCIIYVTHPPCATCAAMIIQTGISKVVTHAPTKEFLARWKDDIAETRFMFSAAGIEFEEVNCETD